MLLRLTLPAIALLYATGCCCCGGGGGSSSSSSTSWTDRLEEEAAEAIAEKVVEKAIGAEELDIDEDGTIKIKTAEGEAVFRGGDEAATITMRGVDGEMMDMALGGSATLPEGFPFDMPADTKLGFSNRASEKSGVAYMVMAEHPSSSLEDIVAHWEDELADLGEIRTTEVTQPDGKGIALVPEGQKDTVITVVSGDGKVMTTAIVKVPKE